MRLYPKTAGTTTVDDPEFGHFEAGDDGGFDLPEPLALRLHAFAINRRKLWETDIEHADRLRQDELDRRRDPQYLLDAVEKIQQHADRIASPPADAKPAARARRKPAATSK